MQEFRPFEPCRSFCSACTGGGGPTCWAVDMCCSTSSPSRRSCFSGIGCWWPCSTRRPGTGAVCGVCSPPWTPPVCRLGFFCCAEGEVSDGDDFIYPAAGTGRRHGPAYPEGCAPCLLPRHIPADPDGERHPCPYSGYPSHRRRAGGGDQRPPSAPGAPHAGALAPAHRLGGWPSAGGEQACRYDGPRLQFPAGHAHRGRSPGLAAGRGLRVPPGEPAGQGHHRTDGGSQERLHPRPAPVRAPHGEVLPGVPGGVHRLSGSEIRHHRRPHRPGPEFCGGPVRPA